MTAHRLRVLHVVPTYLPATRYGGPIYSVHGLCRGLAELGHDIHVFTTNVDGASTSDVPLARPVDRDGVNVSYFPVPGLRRVYWSPKLAVAMKSQIHEFDLVHLHSLFLWPTSAAARLARKAGVPYVIAPRGMLVRSMFKRRSRWIKTAWLHSVGRTTIEGAAALHVTSAVEQREALGFDLSLPTFAHVPNGTDLGRVALASNISEPVRDAVLNQPLVLFLGRINWSKGLDRLVPAMTKVPDAHLVIAGNDEEDYLHEIEALVKHCKIEHRVHFLTAVHGDDKAALLQSARVTVLPSYSENFGNVVLEAMAVGCPTVVTPEVGSSSVVESAKAGIVANGDASSIGLAIKSILVDEAAAQAMGDRGKAVVAAEYAWKAVAERMSRVYQRVANPDPRALPLSELIESPPAPQGGVE